MKTSRVGLIWGLSFLFFKLGVHDMSPTVLVFIRSASGAASLAAIMALTGRSLFGGQLKKRLAHFGIMAVTHAVIPWVAIAWGEERLSSGPASPPTSTTTLSVAVFIFSLIPPSPPSPL